MVSKPLYFDGSNYAYWKARMRVFLQSLDHATWRSVELKYEIPLLSTTTEGVTTTTVKPDDLWTDLEQLRYISNAKALNAIFCAVSADEFKRICNCTTAKEAWDIFETTHEGTSTVKRSKLQLLTTQFENMKMEEHENFMDFYTRLSDVTNAMWGLGERISDPRICRKILRSLPERFSSKVITIEECRDIDTMKIEDLLGSLQTHELHFKKSPKSRNTVLKTSHTTQESEVDSDEELDMNEMALMAKKFRKFFKNKGKRVDKNSKSFDKKRYTGKSYNKPKDPKCYNCGRYVLSS